MSATRAISCALALAAALVSGCDAGKPKPGQWPLSPKELAGEAPPSEGNAELTYRRYCIGCHADDGRANGGTTGADLTATDGPLATKPDAELVASVRDGKLGKTATMPPHKPVLKDAQIAAVIAYLRRRFAPEPPKP